MPRLPQPKSLQEMDEILKDKDPKLHALGLLIQGLLLSQSRGAFTLDEAAYISECIKKFSPKTILTPIPEGSDEDASDSSSQDPEDRDKAAGIPPPPEGVGQVVNE